MRENEGVSAGLFSALRSMAATLLTLAKTRLELLSNEIEARELLVLRWIFLALALSFCFGLGILLAILLLVMLFWEQRLEVFAISSCTFLALGGFLLGRFRQKSRHRGSLFAVSVSELERDIQDIKHEPTVR